ncbi:MAG: transglycosylase SLT domain-containing protein, partial [Rhodoferax sp.]
MHWPQITWIVLAALSLGVVLAKNGQPRISRHSVFSTLIEIAIFGTLLWYGGFFGTAHAQPLPAGASKYRQDLVRAAHSQWGLDAPVAALAAQVHQESGWNPLAVSAVGAKGMAQFMPATTRWWCDANRLSASECQPTNPTWALRSLVGYDKWLWDRAPSRFDAHDRLWVALRSYNGGLGNWQAEARLASGNTRAAIDAACGRARRHVNHCTENLGYPARHMVAMGRVARR